MVQLLAFIISSATCEPCSKGATFNVMDFLWRKMLGFGCVVPFFGATQFLS